MKKILFLLLICLLKLNAYEYLYFKGANVESFYYDNDGSLIQKKVYNDGRINYDYNSFFLNIYQIKTNYGHGLILNSKFLELLRNDLIFLNQFYTTNDITRNALFNYFYNENNFSDNSYINYENYQILYNENGLAVESIVGGVWAGLYSDSEKSLSGYLYNNGGTLIYYNGEKVSWIQSTIDKIIHHVMDNLYTLVHIISIPVGVCVSVVFVLCLAYFVVELGRRAIKPIDDNIRKRNLNE